METAKFDLKGYKHDTPPTIFATIGTALRVYRNSLITRGGRSAYESFEIPYGRGKNTFVTNSGVLYPEIKTFKMWNKDLFSIMDIDWWYYGFSIKVDIGFSETDGKSALIEIPCISSSGFGRMNEVYYEGCLAKIEEDEPPQKQREIFYKMYTIIKNSKEKPKHDFIAPHVLSILVDAAMRNEEICSITHEPITKTNACITSCGHIFSREGVLAALARKEECPFCSKACYLVN